MLTIDSNSLKKSKTKDRLSQLFDIDNFHGVPPQNCLLKHTKSIALDGINLPMCRVRTRRYIIKHTGNHKNLRLKPPSSYIGSGIFKRVYKAK